MYQVELDGDIFTIDLVEGQVAVNGEPTDTEFIQSDAHSGHLLIQGRSVAFFVEEGEDGQSRVSIDGREYATTVKSRKDLLLEKFGASGNAASKHRDIKAPMPGLVLRIDVAVGDTVQSGQPLLVLEAMKMENEISSPGDGIVEAIHVSDGQAVGKSALLLEIGSAEGGE